MIVKFVGLTNLYPNYTFVFVFGRQIKNSNKIILIAFDHAFFIFVYTAVPAIDKDPIPLIFRACLEPQ